MFAWQVDSGDRSRDGWTVSSVSYEVDDVRASAMDEPIVITTVWTHEFLNRPRSTLTRHRSWKPLDEFS